MHLIYISSPVSTYSDTKRYYKTVDGIQRFFPDADIYPARNLYSGPDDWLNTWLSIRDAFDALVFFSDEAGFIDIGCHFEIRGISRAGKPVYYRNRSGYIIPPIGIGLRVEEKNSILLAKVIENANEPKTLRLL